MNALTDTILAPAQASQAVLDTRARIYCGTTVPARGGRDGFQVNGGAVKAFIRDSVASRFPSGFSVFAGAGGWLDAQSQQPILEQSICIEVVGCSEDPKFLEQVKAVAQVWKRLYEQDAVMVTVEALAVVSFV